MSKLLHNLNLEALNTTETENIKGGGVLNSAFNTYCEWYANKANIPLEEVATHSFFGWLAYKADTRS